MVDPDSFPHDRRPMIRRCFFGVTGAIEAAVLTPLNLFFTHLGLGEKRGGWWEAYYEDGVLIAHVPQASPVIDAVASLEPGTEITLVGIAGSWGALGVGDVVEPQTAYHGEAEYQRTFTRPCAFPQVSIETVGSFAESWQRAEAARARASCADMETALVYRAAARQGKHARSIQVISDDMTQRPFYSTDLGQIQASVRRVIEFIRDYIEGRQKGYEQSRRSASA